MAGCGTLVLTCAALATATSAGFLSGVIVCALKTCAYC